MNITKSHTALVASTVRAAGASATVGSWVSCANILGGTVVLKINNSTAPTTGVTAIVETGESTSPTYIGEIARITNDITASSENYYQIPLMPGDAAVRVTFQGNVGGGNVTVQAWLKSDDSIA